MSVKGIQDKLKKGKTLTKYSSNELKYTMKPLGKAIYISSVKNKPKEEEEEIEAIITEKHPRDRIKCKVCGEIYSRSNSWSHRKSKIHVAYDKLNVKLRKILMDS